MLQNIVGELALHRQFLAIDQLKLSKKLTGLRRVELGVLFRKFAKRHIDRSRINAKLCRVVNVHMIGVSIPRCHPAEHVHIHRI